MVFDFLIFDLILILSQVPTIMPAPAIAIKTFFGERAFLLLEGQKVVPKRTLATGFAFDFPNLEGAVRDAIQERQGKK